ncbi:ABC transporter substrate-binding protein [Occultella gossypii]|uniref:Extracellular solute-binding protein n=1 Tax=Occultella gossypii TaxID=2800820 RepID=A0ABS7SD53_9MICO|nr:extracellular solute-binding protein [Occultella gossypii]MBZ2198095.1 extracellular solute-binding protein [Occultella gossypii]
MNTSFTLNRRTLLTAMVGTAGAATLAACNSADGGTDDTGDAPVTLQVWGGVPAETGPDDVIAAFQEEYPHITVIYTRYVNDDTGNVKLDSSLQGGVPIDLFFSYGVGRITTRAESGLMADLTELVSADEDLSRFGPEADPMANYVYDGKVYCVPAALSPQMVFVNVDAIEQAGIEISPDWDVAEYRDVARQLSADGVYGSFGAPTIARPTLGPNALYNEDGTASSYTDPIWREDMQLRVDMQEEGSALPMETILAEKLTDFPHQAFISGRVSMITAQAFLLRYISDRAEFPHDFITRCLPQPAPTSGEEYWNGGAHGDQLAISSASENQEAAWTFLKFWVTQGGEHMLKGGRLPSIIPEDTSALAGELLGENAEELYDVQSFEDVLFGREVKVPIDTITVAARELEDIAETLTTSALLGDLTVDQWVTEITAQSDAAIAQG